MRELVSGDIYDIDGRLREYDPDLSLRYDGNGYWSVVHAGRQGRPYTVMLIGEGCGNRWPKGDPLAPEITRPDMRVLYLVREADLAALGGPEKAVRDMELRELVAKEARKAHFENDVADVAREHYDFFKREVDGMPDMRVFNPVVKPEVSTGE